MCKRHTCQVYALIDWVHISVFVFVSFWYLVTCRVLHLAVLLGVCVHVCVCIYVCMCVYVYVCVHVCARGGGRKREGGVGGHGARVRSPPRGAHARCVS